MEGHLKLRLQSLCQFYSLLVDGEVDFAKRLWESVNITHMLVHFHLEQSNLVPFPPKVYILVQWSAFYINTMKTTSLFKFSVKLYSNYKFTSKQEKLLIDSFSLFSCLCVSMLFESLVEIKN